MVEIPSTLKFISPQGHVISSICFLLFLLLELDLLGEWGPFLPTKNLEHKKFEKTCEPTQFLLSLLLSC